MERKRGIYYYMQKFRFFAVAAVLFCFLLPEGTATAAASVAGLPAVEAGERIFAGSLPAAGPVTRVYPGGDAVAVRLISAGVVVIGFSDEAKDNPARTAGLKKGDRIVALGETQIEGSEDLTKALNENGGNSVSLTYVRGEKERSTTVCPRKNTDGAWQIGVLIKDSAAGIGTLTYAVPETGAFGCLGHGISDQDTGDLFCVGKGTLYPARITGLRKGECGSPGELQGAFGSPALGDCVKNEETGLFGRLDCAAMEDRETVPVADKSEIREGPATIRCTVDEDGIKEYSVQIVRIYRTFGGKTKNMLVRVTDEALLAKTGGIVQGMSGSPILQNGKLVGAITHVLINDPASGYGIFIENMLETTPAVRQSAA